jgi:FAD/FMN-containing dehydrogenase/Fe-S oxidoreductase
MNNQITSIKNKDLVKLQSQLQGDLFFDDLNRRLYATDASVYRRLPLAVALPKNSDDIIKLIHFAKHHCTSLIPRTAGTSLAGQCVGEGVVVDVSKHFTGILDFDPIAKTVTVQPGVIRDELNRFLEPHGLWFAPNTSTSNRCMLGGMVGNNSSGTTSIQYGVTRDKVLALKTILSDGSQVTFTALSASEFQSKLQLNTLEGDIYRCIYNQLSSKAVQKEIKAQFPKPEIHRRNTGYAMDELIKTSIFSSDSDATHFNMCQLLTGSEGTLALTTAITLKLDKLPPPKSVMVALHFKSIERCLKAVKSAMAHDLYTCEMMDDTILNLTKYNKMQQANRQFIVGDPAAILMCELRGTTENNLQKQIDDFLKTFETARLSYAQPVLKGGAIAKALELRKAGLGLLGNMIGDKKAVACIEDTAVAVEDLEGFINEFTQLMQSFNQKAVYYAHAGAGELHLRPILDLKKRKDVQDFREITSAVAQLVKKYKGSISGEHGDGIVRAEFIPMLIGKRNYQILREIKTAFDPQLIFNPGKIVDAWPMDSSLRYEVGRDEPHIETVMDFSHSLGILREAEKCNGSGDCRKLPASGGTMCPSYRATRNEKDSTRARANALREFLTHSDRSNRFNHRELKEVFDLCLSCKACASECPSSVDIASLKAEFQYQYQKANGIPLRNRLFAFNAKNNALGSKFPHLANFLFSNTLTSGLIKWVFGIALERSLPLLSEKTASKAYQAYREKLVHKHYIKEVYLFNDEFTNFLDSPIAQDALELLTALNYKVTLLPNAESGRALISNGLLKEAKAICNQNIELYSTCIAQNSPLVGLEPSAILTFKDEYLKLADNKKAAADIAKHTYLIEDFIQAEIELGHITSEQFTTAEMQIKFHGHCHQKALANQKSSFDVLNVPKNYKVTIIPSGCCGMAGSFGFEKEHFNVSMAIGEQTLFPAIRKTPLTTVIAANGTSCRHQIKDGTNRIAKHPVTILKEALL